MQQIIIFEPTFGTYSPHFLLTLLLCGPLLESHWDEEHMES